MPKEKESSKEKGKIENAKWKMDNSFLSFYGGRGKL
jgi:hypothetical protein